MYTRHFYREDEVYAALTFATAFGRVPEALFWAQELLDSNLGLECLKSLVHSWILFYGLGSFEWLRKALAVWEADEIEEEALLLLTYQLACLAPDGRDSTPLTLIYLTFGDWKDKPPDRLLAHGCPLDSPRSEWEQAVLRAASQKKAEFLWLLFRTTFAEKTQVVWPLLTEACKEDPERSKLLASLQRLSSLLDDPTKQTFLYALGVGAVCLSTLELKRSLQPLRACIDKGNVAELERWTSLLGQKARREYAIPRDCLYWVTERGQMPYTESTLESLKDLLIDIESSDYWSEALESKSFDDLTDVEKLSFLETYFPDGHPMTWTAEDIAKSHGPGILGPKETITLQKWQRKWIRTSTPSRVVWNGWARASKVEISVEDDLHDLFLDKHDQWKQELASWNLRPVKKLLQTS